MKFSYWLNLIGFVSLLLGAGLFINSSFFLRVPRNPCYTAANKKPHPFLCNQKIDIKIAKTTELALVKGISYNKARKIQLFLTKNPQANMTDLIKISGIGPKTIIRLSKYFYSTLSTKKITG
jgi:hypothetical protein